MGPDSVFLEIIVRPRSQSDQHFPPPHFPCTHVGNVLGRFSGLVSFSSVFGCLSHISEHLSLIFSCVEDPAGYSHPLRDSHFLFRCNPRAPRTPGNPFQSTRRSPHHPKSTPASKNQAAAQDKSEFYMKRTYRQDTYQVLLSSNSVSV